jgi:hypothetical protein
MVWLSIFVLVTGLSTLVLLAVWPASWRPAFGYGYNRTVRVLCDLLEKSDDWVIDQYYAHHPIGVELWVASSRYGVKVKIDEKPVDLNAWDRTRLWRSFQQNGVRDPDHTALLLANRIIERYGNEKVVPIGRARA